MAAGTELDENNVEASETIDQIEREMKEPSSDSLAAENEDTAMEPADKPTDSLEPVNNDEDELGNICYTLISKMAFLHMNFIVKNLF